MASETERNKSVIRRFVEEVQNKKDWGVYDELNDPEFVNHSAPPGIPSDREGGKVNLGAFVNAFPDCHFTVDIMRVRDGRIVEHWLSMDQLSFMQQLGVIPT